MNSINLETIIRNLFDAGKLSNDGEIGFHHNSDKPVRKIAYCTNLTLPVIDLVIAKKAELIITHHDAWEFVYELRNDCYNKLKKHNISHFFIHAPLDDCDFGTNETLSKLLGLSSIKKTNLENEKYYCGRISIPENKLTLNKLVSKFTKIINEKVKVYKNNNLNPNKIGIIAGAGNNTEIIKEMLANNVDTIITGEQSLYTVLLCRHMNVNLLIGSHTYTEFPGVESLCKILKTEVNEIKFVKIDENHFEK